ncbi:uncharacterized protein FIBRA_02629 [Fibroporia radiculosa]|uniref:Uncharacterized protein n=1 Tax=Fibroporia radiculosa TaxID=599839 RepID=J4G234_9APHY|nr:uncharacterized protein FIBRA_02629 [Fibroporia radiculosa]CCM00593.1 predicted protein [Fibroporia radiculosa]
MAQVTDQASSLSTWIATSTILDWLKPPRGEAIARLRTNVLGMFTLALLTHLLPLPSPWIAIAILRGKASSSSIYYNLCALETLVLAVLAFNIVQASYALRYPRAIPKSRPPPSPARMVHTSPPPRQWHLKGLSPNSSPQRQKSFSYASSPLSTPSRTLSYTIPPSIATPPDLSFTSSLGSVPGSPASPLAAYRGKHSTMAGRAFDGSLLSRLALEDSSDEE